MSEKKELPEDEEEDATSGPFDGVVWDETTAIQYVDTSTLTLEKLLAIEEVQLEKLTELERAYIKKTIKKCIRIMHHYVNDIYTDMVTDDKPIDP